VADRPHSKALRAKLSVVSVRSVVCLRSGSTIQRSNGGEAIRVHSWLERKDCFGEAAETNTRAACAPQSNIRGIRGSVSDPVQRFNGHEAIRVHSLATPQSRDGGTKAGG